MFESYETHNCKGDTLFPSRGFFNEVTQVKKKVQVKLCFSFSLPHDVIAKIHQDKASPRQGVAKKRCRQDEASPRVGVARRRLRQVETSPDKGASVKIRASKGSTYSFVEINPLARYV